MSDPNAKKRATQLCPRNRLLQLMGAYRDQNADLESCTGKRIRLSIQICGKRFAMGSMLLYSGMNARSVSFPPTPPRLRLLPCDSWIFSAKSVCRSLQAEATRQFQLKPESATQAGALLYPRSLRPRSSSVYRQQHHCPHRAPSSFAEQLACRAPERKDEVPPH